AASAKSTGDAQAFCRVGVPEQAANIAGVERVAAAAAVHQGHGVNACTQADPVVYQDCPVASHGDDGGSRAESAKKLRLAHRISLTANQLRLMIVRKKDIDVR